MNLSGSLKSLNKIEMKEIMANTSKTDKKWLMGGERET